jgi:uncharacterized protein YkwD
VKRRRILLIGAGLALVLVVGLVMYQSRGEVAHTGIGQTSRAVQMLRLTNAARIGANIHRLQRSHVADKLAREHSRAMAAQKRLFHTKHYTWNTWGENVGAGTNVYGLFKAFMHSKEHRINMLNRAYHHLGVGFVRRNGILWVTMVFYG